MPMFFIETPHTKEECLRALDAMADKGKKLLAKTQFGCNANDHRGFAFIDAKNENEAKELIPKQLREKSKVTEVVQMTEDQIRRFHEAEERPTAH
jgi:hypothetical protein